MRILKTCLAVLLLAGTVLAGCDENQSQNHTYAQNWQAETLEAFAQALQTAFEKENFVISCEQDTDTSCSFLALHDAAHIYVHLEQFDDSQSALSSYESLLDTAYARKDQVQTYANSFLGLFAACRNAENGLYTLIALDQNNAIVYTIQQIPVESLPLASHALEAIGFVDDTLTKS